MMAGLPICVYQALLIVIQFAAEMTDKINE